MEDQNINLSDTQMPATNPVPPNMGTAMPVGPTPVVTPAGGAAAVNPPVGQSLPNVPEGSWPGAFGAYKYSRAAVKSNLGTLLLIWLLSIILGSVLDAIFHRAGSFLSLLLEPLIIVSLTIAAIASVRRQHIKFSQALRQGASLYVKTLVLYMLIILAGGISLCLFIIPFFFVLPRTVLAFYFLADRKMGPMESFRASWHAAKGNSGKIWGVIGATLAMALLMITIIGIPFALYFMFMYLAAYAVLYEYINKGAAAPAASSAAPAAAGPMPVAPTMPSSPIMPNLSGGEAAGTASEPTVPITTPTAPVTAETTAAFEAPAATEAPAAANTAAAAQTPDPGSSVQPVAGPDPGADASNNPTQTA